MPRLHALETTRPDSQSTAAFTPLLSVALGQPVPARALWLSSALALAGSALVALDHAPTLGDGAELALQRQGQLAGDLATLVAAACYSLATARLPAFAAQVPPLRLALARSLLLAALSAAAAAAAAWRLHCVGQPLPEALWPGWRDPQAWTVVAWAALGPGAAAAYLAVR